MMNGGYGGGGGWGEKGGGGGWGPSSYGGEWDKGMGSKGGCKGYGGGGGKGGGMWDSGYGGGYGDYSKGKKGGGDGGYIGGKGPSAGGGWAAAAQAAASWANSSPGGGSWSKGGGGGGKGGYGKGGGWSDPSWGGGWGGGSDGWGGGWGGAIGPHKGGGGGDGGWGGPPSIPTEPICGVVKTFDEEKSYGFVSSESIRKLFGKDVFISKVSLGDQKVQVGDQVRFMCVIGNKGPQAQDAYVLPPGSFIANVGDEGVSYSGSVKNYKGDKGWGFVTCPRTTELFGKDIFLHKRELPEEVVPVAGEPAEFSVKLNNKALPEATLVRLTSRPETGYAPVQSTPEGVRSAPY